MAVAQIRKVLKVQQIKKNDMGYLIFNTDRDDEMQSVRHNMRRMMRGGGYSPMMRHEEERDKMYEHGYRAGWEDAEEEHYRRQRDSRGRYM